MTLIDVVAALAALPEEHTIYAVLPWTASSEAIVLDEDEAESRPDAGRQRVGEYRYFIEVFLAKEFLGGWVGSATEEIPLADLCQRLIDYAVNDT